MPKESFDFKVYEKEFAKKLYYDEKGGKEIPKAVMQLINNIRKLLKKEFHPDTEYKYREVTIFPILLIHDNQYDVVGFNALINHWFQYELELLKEEGFFTNRVRSLIVVNIDSLIYHQVVLRKVFLQELLKEYDDQVRRGISAAKIRKTMGKLEVRDMILSTQIPFSWFIGKKFISQTSEDIVPHLQALVHSLFNQQIP